MDPSPLKLKLEKFRTLVNISKLGRDSSPSTHGKATTLADFNEFVNSGLNLHFLPRTN
jgi:hypothetical protein